jgi:hypothetical protein
MGEKNHHVPWHLWVVGLTGLLLAAYPTWDWSMVQAGNEGHLAGLSEEWRAVLDRQPFWVDAAWFIAVWGFVLGCILLLLRRRWAWPVFAAAAVGIALDQAWLILATEEGAIVASIAITGAFVLFAFYSWAMSSRGVLR